MNNVVHAIVEDRQVTLWFGTEGGVCAFTKAMRTEKEKVEQVNEELEKLSLVALIRVLKFSSLMTRWTIGRC